MSGLEGLLAGRLLGDRYRIEEVIGRGGMGAVYRATDERLGRQVAVKVITVAGGAEPDARERLRARFYREARAAAALPHHPNVVPVYDYGSDATLGLDYIVMELLRGHDLATRLARAGPPPLAEGLRILYEAARGVAVGHRSGLIHRDVKPGNIFLAQTGHEEIQVRMVDFGIAKLADDEDTFAHLTQDGRVPHSPAFASPEQLRGLSDLTPASDVFSLGAVGFALLTGQRPFTEADRNRLSLGMPVPPPSLRQLNQAIPTPVEAIIQKALAFDPEDRYPDASSMAAALGDALRLLPETPVEPYAAPGMAPLPSGTPDERAGRTAEEADDRTRAMDGEDDRTLLAPVPGPSGGPRERGPTRPPTRAFPQRRAPERRGVGGTIVWLLVFLLLAAAGFWIWSESQPRPQVAGETEIPPPPDSIPIIAPETELEDTAGGQPELQALVLNNEGMNYFRAENYAAAAENFRAATELVPGNPDYAFNYGYALLRLGDAAEAANQLARAARIDPDRPRAHYNLGVAQLMLGDTVSAWASLQRALELAQTPAERAAALREIRAIESAQLRRDTVADTAAGALPRPPRADTVPARSPARTDTVPAGAPGRSGA